MGTIEWVFSGVGTALAVFALSFVGAKTVNRRRRLRQTQKAGDSAVQVQSGRDTRVER